MIEPAIEPVVEPLCKFEEEEEVENDQRKETPISVNEKEINKEEEN